MCRNGVPLLSSLEKEELLWTVRIVLTPLLLLFLGSLMFVPILTPLTQSFAPILPVSSRSQKWVTYVYQNGLFQSCRILPMTAHSKVQLYYFMPFCLGKWLSVSSLVPIFRFLYYFLALFSNIWRYCRYCRLWLSLFSGILAQTWSLILLSGHSRSASHRHYWAIIALLRGVLSVRRQ